MNKKIKSAVLIIAASVILAGCGINNASNSIIKVNDTVITKQEYNKAFNEAAGMMLKSMGINPDRDKDNIMVLTLKGQVVSQLVINAMLNDEIKKNNITVSKEELDAAEKEITGRFGSKEQFEQLLKASGASYDDFRKNLEEEVKIKKYVDGLSIVSIGDSEALKYYKENPDKFKYPEQVRASHILVSANENTIKSKIKKDNKNIKDDELKAKLEQEMKAAKEKAENLRAQVLKDPSKFAELAKANSDDTASAANGGDLDFFAKEDMTPNFSKAAFSLKPNVISEIVETPYGYHIIMVTDRKAAGKYTFEETKKDILDMLTNKEKMKIFQNKISELSKNAKIEYLDENYNPETIKTKLKSAIKDNPDMKETVENENKEPAPKE